MIRLGELTQSNPEIGKIGTVSNRIGRELLFGNTEDVIWEYVGPDLILDTPVMELETEETFSERLPEDFTELGSTAIEEKENAEPSSTELTSEKSIAESSTATRDRLDSESEEEFLLLESRFS